jgi:DNA-binding MurR/RpiR family transcriptional regulator
MSIKDVFASIKAEYVSMSKGHRKIADYILENYQKASFMTALSLGQAVGVSESTVVRFAMELGFDGYPDFQENLRLAMRSKLTSVERIELASSQMDKNDVYEKVMSLDIERIRETIENGDREAFYGAVDIILSTLFGIVTSLPSLSFITTSFVEQPVNMNDDTIIDVIRLSIFFFILSS